MTILLLRVPSQRHAASKESEMPDIGSNDTGPGVDTENLDTREGSDHSDPEAEHVRDGGDGDGDCSLSICLTQPH